MTFYLYQVLLFFYALIATPKWLFQALIHNEWNFFLEKWGLRVPKLSSPLIWIHAVSLGETKAIVPLAKKLKTAFPGHALLISSITDTGHAEAKQALKEAEAHIFLPLDLSFVVKRVIRRLKPSLVLLSETDLWPAFLLACKKEGVSLVLVNGKISARSQKRYKRFPKITQKLFSLFDAFLMQNESYAQRLEELNIPPQKIVVTGNLKFDEMPKKLSPDELVRFREHLKIDPRDFIVTIGSTHHPEEREFLSLFSRVWKSEPHVTFLLVPRHPRRFDEVAHLLKKETIPFRRYSESLQAHEEAHVVLVDAMGLLMACYQLSDLAIVAGSFGSKVGGHNLIEPTFVSTPVLFGPYTAAQEEMKRLVLQSKAGFEISLEHIPSLILSLLHDPERREILKKRALALSESLQGGTEKSYKELLKFLKLDRMGGT